MTKKDNLNLVQTSGGRGTRCRPLNLYSPTSMIPKGLMRVMGLPIAELQMRQIKEFGVRDVYVITQYLENREHLSNRFGDGARFKMNIHYSDPFDDKSNNGSGDAILRNIEKKELKGTSIILSNDNFYEVDLESALRDHKKSGAVISLMTVSMPPRSTIGNYGLVNTTPDHKIIRLDEKPKNENQVIEALGLKNSSELISSRADINTAGYIVDNDALLKIMRDSWVINGRKNPEGFDMAGNLVEGLIKHKYPVYSIGIDAWGDLGTTDFFLDTFPDALSGKFPSILKVLERQGYEHDSRNNLWIHKDSLKRKDKSGKTLEKRISKGDVEIGPNVFIGRNCVIENGARIRFSNIEKYARVNEGTELDRVYLSPYCEIGPYSTLKECALGLQVDINSSKNLPACIHGRSIIGPEILIPKGTRLANVKVFPGYEFKGEGKTYSDEKLVPFGKELMGLLEKYS